MKRAFTLIEIIFVIAVILLVAALGVGGYTASRRNMAIDLETDRLVVLLHELRDASKKGNVCYGLRLKKNEALLKIEKTYLNKKAGCGDVKKQSEILWEGEVDVSELAIIFIPPHGEMKIEPVNEKTEIRVNLKKNHENGRTVLFEPKTGLIKKSK